MQVKQINEYPILTTYTGSYKFLADPGNGKYYSITMDKLSPVEGSASITTLGTITTGVWNGTAIADNYIASASTWNAKSDFSGSYNDLTNIPAKFTPESHTHTLSEVTDSGTAASKDFWTGTQAQYDSNTVKDGIAAQSADIAIIIG